MFTTHIINTVFSLQDGIPISTELQYLIANSQQDLATTLGAESQSDHILVPPEAFEDRTVDLNCELWTCSSLRLLSDAPK